MKTFISVEEAHQIIQNNLPHQPTEQTTYTDALGRTLAQDIQSHDTIPPFDNSAMDGFAVRTADLQDTPATLTVTADIPAGTFPDKPVTAGTCARIMTGAPFPEGADAVAPVEWTEPAGSDTVLFRQAPSPGQHVRRAGKDIQQGQMVFHKGQVVTPPVLGMLATLGYASITVYRAPRVAVIATGDELVPADQTPGPGQIRNANGPALVAQLHTAGAIGTALHALDDKDAIRATIEQALDADMLLFSGGVSVGDYDFVKQVLDEMGMEVLFWKVKQRPGKPLAFGRLQGKPVFGLPGNPVSAAMCFEQYVRPALAIMLGRTTTQRPRHPALLDTATPKVPGLHFFTRGIAYWGEDGRLHVRDTGPQGSNLYSSVVRANCIVHLPATLDSLLPGTTVQIEWLTWDMA